MCSPRHYDKLARAAINKITCRSDLIEQGFVDQRGMFMTREEAWAVAEAAGQIVRRCGGDGEKLFSENLY